MAVIIKDSCMLVYQSPRYGGALQCPNDNGTSGSGGSTTLPLNKTKFESNGCRKVNREFNCKTKLFRG